MILLANAVSALLAMGTVNYAELTFAIVLALRLPAS